MGTKQLNVNSISSVAIICTIKTSRKTLLCNTNVCAECSWIDVGLPKAVTEERGGKLPGYHLRLPGVDRG